MCPPPVPTQVTPTHLTVLVGQHATGIIIITTTTSSSSVVLVGVFNSLYSGPAAMRPRKVLVKVKNKKCMETNKQTEDTSRKAYTK